MPMMPGEKRSEELDQQGTLFSRARAKISSTSARFPAIGLSIKSGLPAAITGRA